MYMRFKLFLCSLCLALATFAQKGTIKVAVFSINDFHGAFVQNVSQAIPGAPSIWQTLDSLKAVYPYNITVAAGDNFGGSYFYRATQGQLLPVFFNDLGIRISALGNHEFDDGQASLAEKWSADPLLPRGWDITYVCSNVYDSNGHIPPYVKPFATTEIKLSPTKTLKAAFVGLLASSAPEQIRANNVVGLHFSGNYTHVLDSLAQTPGFKEVQEADLRMLLVHIGTIMKGGKPVWTDKDEENLARIDDKLYQGILSGHSHEPVCGRINKAQYPVVQGWWHGNYISIMKFTVDTAAMRVLDVEPEICRVPLKSRDQLSAGPLRLQMQIDSLLQTTKTPAGVPIGTKLTTATRDMPHDRTDSYRLSEVGTLVCASFAEAYRNAAARKDKDVIVGCSHFGSIRAGFSKGDVSVLEVGEALPFANALKAYAISGKQLKDLVNFGFHNKRYGWMQSAYLSIKRNDEGEVTAITYISPKGKKVKIKDNTKLILVADEFMTTGGDGYPTKYFPKEQLINTKLPKTTDAFIAYLKRLPQIPF